jgi:hypothetical protein
LDWEDYGSNTMSVSQAKEWITQVETALGRPNECVICSGNTAKEMLDGADAFFGSRRLWLAQYGSTPQPQESWDSYWLWQFTDGIYGPSPHSIDGVGPCELVRRYAGRAGRTMGDWIGGTWTSSAEDAASTAAEGRRRQCQRTQWRDRAGHRERSALQAIPSSGLKLLDTRCLLVQRIAPCMCQCLEK